MKGGRKWIGGPPAEGLGCQVKESGLSAVGNRKPFGGLKQGGWCSQSCVRSKRLLWLNSEDGQAGDGRQGAKDEAVPICL